jgi:glycosyltransferase involved in cell wall biosynthesis
VYNRRLRVLVSAYACEPGKGSEQAVGWNAATALARYHDIWVLTRSNNRERIERELKGGGPDNLNFIYFDLPQRFMRWKHGQLGLQHYYYRWQLGAARVALEAHAKIGFDIVHHVTFAKYWAPSVLWKLAVPLVWGPVGGGDSAPVAFMREVSWRGVVYECQRHIARAIAEHDILVRRTARKSTIALAATEATARRLRKLGARDIRAFSQVGLSTEELEALGRSMAMGPLRQGAERVILSLGNLTHLKGHHLGIRAFARAAVSNARYVIVGDGPERERLRALAKRLGVANKVTFLGRVERNRVVGLLSRAEVTVHPSIYESGGLACAESLAAGVPVICLDGSGPAQQVAGDCGFIVSRQSPGQAVADMATAIQRLLSDRQLHQAMSVNARARAVGQLAWANKAAAISDIYEEAILSRGGLRT